MNIHHPTVEEKNRYEINAPEVTEAFVPKRRVNNHSTHPLLMSISWT